MAGDSKSVAGYSTETVSAVDGLPLFCRRWDPATEAIATVVIVHGIGEHSGRYVHVGRYFAEAGFRTIAFDLRGHGRSPGRPVFVQALRGFGLRRRLLSSSISREVRLSFSVTVLAGSWCSGPRSISELERWRD